MEECEYEKMYQLESTYWWYVGRRSIIKSVLENYQNQEKFELLVDLGCGTGTNLDLLGTFANEVQGIDISPHAIEFAKKRGFSNVHQTGSIEHLEYENDSVDVATFFDVLEHIENEEQALSDIHRVLKPGGLLVLTVPAYQFLWSEHDVALHHFRRYNANNLQAVLKRNEFQIERLSYTITFLLPLVIIYRVLKGTTNLFRKSAPTTSFVVVPKFINKFFINLLKIEAKLLKIINFPAGTSLIVVARKSA